MDDITPSSSIHITVQISLPPNRLSTMAPEVTNHPNNIVLPSSSSAAHSTKSKSKTIYFGYGSNLWLHQMRQRCPTSKYIGIARLTGYQWIIYKRGYANIVKIDDGYDEENVEEKEEKHEWEHEVWGLVYELEQEDERRLDRNEGVPVAYQKRDIECELWRSKDTSSRQRTVDTNQELRYTEHGKPDTTTKPEKIDMLVYINETMTEEGEIKEEYIYRMNMGIRDAVREGVPREYVRKVLRRWIPEKDSEHIEKVARRQALEFEDEE